MNTPWFLTVGGAMATLITFVAFWRKVVVPMATLISTVEKYGPVLVRMAEDADPERVKRMEADIARHIGEVTLLKDQLTEHTGKVGDLEEYLHNWKHRWENSTAVNSAVVDMVGRLTLAVMEIQGVLWKRAEDGRPLHDLRRTYEPVRRPDDPDL